MNNSPWKKTLRASTLVSTVAFLLSCANQEKQPAPASDAAGAKGRGTIAYDSVLAARLGADEYGMRSYVMAFLKAGPRRNQDSITAARIQEEHLRNIVRLGKEGTLVLAGPFLDKGEVRGIYLFNVKTLEEARVLTESDPTVRAGRLTMELHPWYGPASLVQVTEMNESVAKSKIVD
jgi:uncharacterized protein